jgi:hypothetical protein
MRLRQHLFTLQSTQYLWAAVGRAGQPYLSAPPRLCGTKHNGYRAEALGRGGWGLCGRAVRPVPTLLGKRLTEGDFGLFAGFQVFDLDGGLVQFGPARKIEWNPCQGTLHFLHGGNLTGVWRKTVLAKGCCFGHIGGT